MLRKFYRAALLGLALATIVVSAYGASTIDPNLPANGQPYSASVIRGQFQAAINDIQALQSMNAGTTQPFSCTLANEGAVWLNNTSSPFVLNVCDGNSSWVPYIYLDTSNHIASSVMGRGAQQTLTAATTTDLGSVPQSSILVSGSSVSITSLGSSAKAGDIKIVQFNGANTLTYNAVSLILPGATNSTTANGTVWIFESLGSGNWLGVATNTPSSSNGSQTAAAAGTSTKVSGSLSSAASSVTMSADAVVVATALNGTTYVLPSYSQTLNTATTGAGGMDTGTLPSSGYLCIYAIYNPTTLTASILGSNCSTSSGTIYSGGNAPSGYTASALIAAWPTNSTPNMVAGWIRGRAFTYQTSITVLSGSTTGHASFVSLSISSAIPPNAVTSSGRMEILGNTSQSATGVEVDLSPDGTAIVQWLSAWMIASVAAQISGIYSLLPVTTAQTLQYQTQGIGTNISLYIVVNGFTF